MSYLKLFGVAAFAIGAILYLASSDEHKVIVGEQNYILTEYVHISDSSSTYMKVRAGEEYSLNIKADERDLETFKIYVKGHTLVIEKKQTKYDSWHGDRPEISITLPKLKKFTLNGSSDVEIEGIHGDFFKAVVNGSGVINFDGASKELTAIINGTGSLHGKPYKSLESAIIISGNGSAGLSGNCKLLEIEIKGSGEFYGKDYKCNMVGMEIIGNGEIEVYASELVDVDVLGYAKIHVYGKPEKVIDRTENNNHLILH